jgi:hypothetical protein
MFHVQQLQCFTFNILNWGAGTGLARCKGRAGVLVNKNAYIGNFKVTIYNVYGIIKHRLRKSN